MPEAEEVESTEDEHAEFAAMLDEQEETESEEETEEETEETAEEETQEDSEDSSEEESEETEETEETKTEETDDDPELSKHLKKIQTAEKRSKERISKDREEVAKQIEEYKPKLAALADFEKLKGRVRSNPVEVLRALGVTDDDLSYVSRQAWYQSSEGSKDSKAKDSVASERRSRAQETELDEVKRKLEETTKRLDDRETEATSKEKIVKYMGTVEKAVSDDAPLVALEMKNDPDGTREDLRKIADRMANENQEIPDPIDVVKALEASRIKALKKLGIDPKTVTDNEATEETDPSAEKKKTAKTLSSNLGKRTKPRKKASTREEEYEQVLKEDWG